MYVRLKLAVAQLAALRLQCLGTGCVTVAALQPHLLRQVVDLRPQRIALGLQFASTCFERDGLGQLLEQFGLVAAGQGGPHALGVGTQQSNVDHMVKARPPPASVPETYVRGRRR